MKNNPLTDNEITSEELNRKLKKQKDELSLVDSLQHAVLHGRDISEIFSLLKDPIINHFVAQTLIVSTFDQEKKIEIFKFVFIEGNTHQIDPRTIDKLGQQIIDSGEFILINNGDEAHKKLIQFQEALPAALRGILKAKSLIYMPLILRKEVIGYLSLQNSEKENSFNECDLDLLRTVANSICIALENTESKTELQEAKSGLKSAQEQLIKLEKLASLGKLTAGIAHEIKNPLNFVNNFSDLNVELIEEVYEELKKLEKNDTISEIFEILGDLKSNLKKIHQHGQRADGIVKSMLLHSRGGSGKIEPTDLNGLIREYVNLSFHGMRAGKNAINVSLDLQLDENVGLVPLISEDFSRVILNLSNNAFDAMREKFNTHGRSPEYHPILTVKTLRLNETVEIQVKDNGGGVPDEFKEKILQPFFTTKKSTEGTGLGLSITHEIIKAHNGSLDIVSDENSYTSFNIVLSNLKKKKDL